VLKREYRRDSSRRFHPATRCPYAFRYDFSYDSNYVTCNNLFRQACIFEFTSSWRPGKSRAHTAVATFAMTRRRRGEVIVRSARYRDIVCRGGHSELSSGLFYKLDGLLSWRLVKHVNTLHCSLKKDMIWQV